MKKGMDKKRVRGTIGVVLFIVLSAMTMSCKQESSISETTAKLDSSTAVTMTDVPYASEENLSRYAGDTDIIPYKVDRALGLIELSSSIKESYGWTTVTFSSKPVIIYGSDSRPLYYEFIVLSESGTELGTVTLYARKTQSTVIKNVFPYVRDYNGLVTKGSEYKLFADDYPRGIYYGIPSKSGEEPSVLIDPATNESTGFKRSVEDEKEYFLSLSAEELKLWEIEDVHQFIAKFETEKAEYEVYAEEFWKLMESLPFDIAEKMTDETITDMQNESKAWWDPYVFHEIPAYNTEAMRRTYWSGYCGPSAMAWIYRGKFDSYKGVYLPLWNDPTFKKSPDRVLKDNLAKYYSQKYLTNPAYMVDESASKIASINADNSLWYDGADKSGTLAQNGHWGGMPTYPHQFCGGLLYTTNNEYSIRYKWTKNGVVEAISEDNPVISYYHEGHWVVYYGVERDCSFKLWYEWVQKTWYFGYWELKTDIKDNYKFKIHDNTVVTGTSAEYWEDYNPFTLHFYCAVVKYVPLEEEEEAEEQNYAD